MISGSASGLVKVSVSPRLSIRPTVVNDRWLRQASKCSDVEMHVGRQRTGTRPCVSPGCAGLAFGEEAIELGTHR